MDACDLCGQIRERPTLIFRLKDRQLTRVDETWRNTQGVRHVCLWCASTIGVAYSDAGIDRTDW